MIEHLNVPPLGPYNMFLGIDLLFIHIKEVEFYDKAIECLDDDGENRIL